MTKGKVLYIDEVEIKNKSVVLRTDFDVSLHANLTIADDARIRNNLPTIEHLLKNNNRLICIAKLGRPKGKDLKLSLSIVVKRLREYLPGYEIQLVNDFLTEEDLFKKQTPKQILVLENIRFYPEEKKNDNVFAKKLAQLGDVYVNDAFAMSHRVEASIVGITAFLPSYGGLLLKKEVSVIEHTIRNPQKPFTAIIGGAKIADKMNLLERLIEIADDLIVGGGLANTFLAAQGFSVGKSLYDKEHLDQARRLFFVAAEKHTAIHLPVDVAIGKPEERHISIERVESIPDDMYILDIGPETKAKFGHYIAHAKTIIWNGPIGYFENPTFRQGTDFIYHAIAHNRSAVSIVGGGDTLSAISKREYLHKITHVSTGGGAMLEFIEKGTLPGIEALRQK